MGGLGDVPRVPPTFIEQTLFQSTKKSIREKSENYSLTSPPGKIMEKNMSS